MTVDRAGAWWRCQPQVDAIPETFDQTFRWHPARTSSRVSAAIAAALFALVVVLYLGLAFRRASEGRIRRTGATTGADAKRRVHTAGQH